MRATIGLALLALLALLPTLPGCDPCFGTASCTDAHVHAVGRLFWHLDSTPAEGARVVFYPTGGTEVRRDSLVGRSDENGIFQLRGEALGPGEVVGDLVFFPPPPWQHFIWGPQGVRISTTTTRGDAHYIGLWGVGPIRTDPHVSYVGEVYYADTEARAEGVEVEFRRTAGLLVEPDTFRVVSGADGRFPLFMQAPSEGEVVGDLIIHAQAPYRPRTIQGLRLAATVARDVVRLAGTWAIERVP